jgi:hypothetical protein
MKTKGKFKRAASAVGELQICLIRFMNVARTTSLLARRFPTRTVGIMRYGDMNHGALRIPIASFAQLARMAQEAIESARRAETQVICISCKYMNFRDLLVLPSWFNSPLDNCSAVNHNL